MRKRKRRSDLLTRIIASLLVLIGYISLMLPMAMDQFARVGQTSTIAAYEKSIDRLNDEEISAAFKKCDEYNEKIAKEHEENYYHYSSKFEFSQDYLDLPIENITEIATLSIPSVNINLPVAHGTEDQTLQNRLGHLYGTSFPSGGNSTHSVIAGHTALRTSEMFDRLDELKIGDKFYVEVLNEVHEYQVDQIKIVKPEEHDEYLQVIPNKDYVTLYTCTPYGINSHRLLVRGERIGDYIPPKKESTSAVVKTDTLEPFIKLTIISIIPIILIFIVNKLLVDNK